MQVDLRGDIKLSRKEGAARITPQQIAGAAGVTCRTVEAYVLKEGWTENGKPVLLTEKQRYGNRPDPVLSKKNGQIMTVTGPDNLYKNCGFIRRSCGGPGN